MQFEFKISDSDDWILPPILGKMRWLKTLWHNNHIRYAPLLMMIKVVAFKTPTPHIQPSSEDLLLQLPVFFDKNNYLILSCKEWQWTSFNVYTRTRRQFDFNLTFDQPQRRCNSWTHNNSKIANCAYFLTIIKTINLWRATSHIHKSKQALLSNFYKLKSLFTFV